jgi:hypothetical protein
MKVEICDSLRLRLLKSGYIPITRKKNVNIDFYYKTQFFQIYVHVYYLYISKRKRKMLVIASSAFTNY